MKLTVRPLTDRAWVGAAPREASRFTATWSATLNLLEREVYALQRAGMDDPILMVDVSERDVRLDGQLRADARPFTDAVAIAFESTRGPLIFRADRYDSKPWGSKMDRVWQHNVRAIALTLEALRAADRYGATVHGEQYVGYRQIEAAQPPVSASRARQLLLQVIGDHTHALDDDRVLVAAARRRAHPDMPTGSRETWDEVQRLATTMGVGL